MPWYVSRQHYYYSGEKIVEVETSGGLDYAGADMLVKKYKAEQEEYCDPREAINAAIAIRDAWRKDDNDPEINIGIGTTHGMGLELPSEEKTDEELRQFAEQCWEKIPKCDQCGEPIQTKYNLVDDQNAGDFCSSECCEAAVDAMNQRTCQTCGEDVPDGRKYFCTDECEENYKY